MRASELIPLLRRLVDEHGDPVIHVAGYYSAEFTGGPGDPVEDVCKQDNGWILWPPSHCIYWPRGGYSLVHGAEYEDGEDHESLQPVATQPDSE